MCWNIFWLTVLYMLTFYHLLEFVVLQSYISIYCAKKAFCDLKKKTNTDSLTYTLTSKDQSVIQQKQQQSFF